MDDSLIINDKQGINIIIKWDRRMGYDYEDRNKIKYMKTKYLILSSSTTYDTSWTPNDVINDYNHNMDWIINYMNINRNNIKLIMGRGYIFNERFFISKNMSFINFISKCKQYYSNRLKSYKNPINIFKTQLYGIHHKNICSIKVY